MISLRQVFFAILAASVGFIGSWLVLIVMLVFYGSRQASGVGVNVRAYIISVSIPAALVALLLYGVIAWLRSR